MERLSDRRPWGWYKGIGFKRFWVKVIRVEPEQCTSRQYHANRSELHMGLDRWHWQIVRPYETHRLLQGLYLELAWGSPREDDIVRLRDRYGRTNSQTAKVGARAHSRP